MTLKETKHMREFATSLRRSVRQHSVRDKSEKRHCTSSLCHIVFVKRTRAFFQCWNNRFDGGPKWRTTARPRVAVFIHFIHPLFQVKASDRCKAQPQKRTLAVFPCPARISSSRREREKNYRLLTTSCTFCGSTTFTLVTSSFSLRLTKTIGTHRTPL